MTEHTKHKVLSKNLLQKLEFILHALLQINYYKYLLQLSHPLIIVNIVDDSTTVMYVHVYF